MLLANVPVKNQLLKDTPRKNTEKDNKVIILSKTEVQTKQLYRSATFFSGFSVKICNKENDIFSLWMLLPLRRKGSRWQFQLGGRDYDKAVLPMRPGNFCCIYSIETLEADLFYCRCSTSNEKWTQYVSTLFEYALHRRASVNIS
ncbi:hypothetical protein [Desulfovibrio inopinatus]|uniref:hypothetical protein n=1 Tax=Desulfovibrio inopinatus TaxID=102109 RepID=UPI00040A247F|nr:hypothetical protein [Desulfovibrio inopinatus]